MLKKIANSEIVPLLFHGDLKLFHGSHEGGIQKTFSTIKRKTDTTIFSEHVEKTAEKLAFEGECSK